MVTWSPSSYSLFKKCPVKYRIKKIDKSPNLIEDTAYKKLAVPGLVVDKLLQFWLHRKKFNDLPWLLGSFDMVWNMVEVEIKPKWESEEEIQSVIAETQTGLRTAIRMLGEFPLAKYDILVQPNFREKITEEFSIVGFADTVLTDPITKESILIDFKNNHSRQRVTRDQLLFYQMGLRKSLGLNIVKAGYLMFNPRLEQWKWLRLTERLEEKLLNSLAEATKLVDQNHYDYKWNHFSCTRYCELRFNCEMFHGLMDRKNNDEIRFANNTVEI